MPLTKPQLMAATWYFCAMGQDGVEGAAGAARHVFGAEDGAVILLEPLDVLLEVFGPAVVVEGDDVGLFDLDARRWRPFFRARTNRRSRRRW